MAAGIKGLVEEVRRREYVGGAVDICARKRFGTRFAVRSCRMSPGH